MLLPNVRFLTISAIQLQFLSYFPNVFQLTVRQYQRQKLCLQKHTKIVVLEDFTGKAEVDVDILITKSGVVRRNQAQSIKDCFQLTPVEYLLLGFVQVEQLDDLSADIQRVQEFKKQQTRPLEWTRSQIVKSKRAESLDDSQLSQAVVDNAEQQASPRVLNESKKIQEVELKTYENQLIETERFLN